MHTLVTQAAGLACLATCTATALGQAFDWTQSLPTAAPSARRHAVLASDDNHNEVVLFGGWASGVLADTWTWNGYLWTQRTPAASPPARENHAMAYDAARQRIVLFGGFDGGSSYFGDTWEWDGNTWQQRITVGGPSSRRSHAMAYDPARQVVVLFGGYDGSPRNDTWEWNGSSWLQIVTTSTPPARSEHAMTFDPSHQRTMLLGGVGVTTLGDVWEWDGALWAPVFAATYPPPRTRSRMVGDSARQRVVLFGGYSNGFLNETWQWNGTNWSLLSPATNPPSRESHGMAYDALLQQVVLFGGNNFSPVLGDTWVTGDAAATPYGAGCGSPSLLFAPAGRPLLGQFCSATIADAPLPFGGVAMGWSRDYAGPFALPATLASLGMPGCDLWQSAEIIGLTVTPLTPTTMSFGFAIPSQPTFIGTHVYLQAYALAPNQNPAWIIVSNAIDWRLGAF